MMMMGPSTTSTPATTTTTTASASDRGGGPHPPPAPLHHLCRSSSGCSKPSWLQAALADVEQRYQTLSLHHNHLQRDHHRINNNNADAHSSVSETDSFADRAENYYQKRPQLLSLLHDLYHRYLSLADRYTQALLRSSSSAAQTHHHQPADLDDAATVVTDLTDPDPDHHYSSDSESSFCFSNNNNINHHHHHHCHQQPKPPPIPPPLDTLVAELVTKLVDNHLLRQFCADMDRRVAEAARRAALQGSLVDVLESERAVLVAENARLAARADAAEAEREALAAEAAYLRRRAADLARAAAGMREDHRACALGRRIEALQAQVYGLERRNREIGEAMARREEEKNVVVRGVCRELERVRAENLRLRNAATAPATVHHADDDDDDDAPRAKKKRRTHSNISSAAWWRPKGVARSIEAWLLCGSNANRNTTTDHMSTCSSSVPQIN